MSGRFDALRSVMCNVGGRVGGGRARVCVRSGAGGGVRCVSLQCNNKEEEEHQSGGGIIITGDKNK